MPETLSTRWARRSLSIPAVFLALGLSLPALPVLLALALGVDVLRSAGRRTWASLRLLIFLECYLAVESLGVLALWVVWWMTLGNPPRRAQATWRVQRAYTSALFMAACRSFNLRFEVEGADLAAVGPVLLLVRHASIVDTLVPSVYVANRFELRLRYVLKRELLWVPCLDVAGHWIPNHFAARAGRDTTADVESVRALKRDLQADEGVVIYPEGTRFSVHRREQLLNRLASDEPAHARALRLRHLLPIRPGGALALLDAQPSCDVVLMGHHGLEGFSHLRDIWAGDLVGATIRVRLWRESASAIPATAEQRLLWLQACWERLDQWLESLEVNRA